MDNKIDYTNMEFPLYAKYKRSKDRIYFATDFEDGEELEYYGKVEKPSSNAMGYRYYKNSKGYIRLTHYTDLEIIKR